MNRLNPWAVDPVGALVRPDAKQYPFSFLWDGQPSARLLTGWTGTRHKEPAADGRTRESITFTDPDTGVTVTCDTVFYTDFPAVEWTLNFRNTGTAPSPLISDIRALDMALPVGAARKPLVHAARGGVCTPEDYEPLPFDLTAEGPVRLHPDGGRSSNGYLPFFNVDAGDRGVVVALGWSGQWCADLAMEDASTVRLRADIAETRLRLQPGEAIRTARILLVFWEGHRLSGHNLLRRLIYRHCTPLLDGQKPLPHVQCNTWFPVGDNGGNATAENQTALLHAYRSLGIEYLVMDAGWFGDSSEWWPNAGTWRPRKDAFPHGLRPIGEVAREAGIRFGMWFEPERVHEGTKLDADHPEWLISLDGQQDRLLNLGLPEVRRWFIDMVSRYVEDVPLGYFRHDFNINPLPYWQKADPPERIGSTEIHYVTGLYEIWDALHARYPGLMMEGCSSGGRRIDLESISRCHTYWKTDLYGFSHANQGHVYGAGLYLPGNYLNTPLFSPGCKGYIATHYIERNTLDGMLTPHDPYPFHSMLGGALCLGWDPRLPAFDTELAGAWIERFKRLRHLFVGDFYPLSPYSLQPTDWIAYQFHRDDLEEGMAVFFRREQSASDSLEVTLQGLRDDRVYELHFEDRGESRSVTGAEAGHPMRITIETCPGSVLLVYRQMEA